MLRIFHGEEISHTANDLRPTIRQCIKYWQPTLQQRGCKLTVDLSISMPVLCQAEDTHALIQGMFDLTVGRLADGGELSVVGCRGTSAIELEIADSGQQLHCDVRCDRKLFPPRAVVHDRRLVLLQTLAQSFQGRIWATPCPQGGMAWTLRLPARIVSRRAA
ncbi:MAG: hypothetical protein ACTHOU_11070 [Aureliella sp.]